MKPTGESAEINAAAAYQPKSGHTTPAAAGKGPSGAVGSMSKADMEGAFSNKHHPLKLK